MKTSIKEYAELKKITIQGVYKALREGRLETVIENGTKYVIIADQENRSEPSHEKTTTTDPKAEILTNEVKHLKELLKIETEARERAEKREENLTHLLAMSNKNINNLSENIKLLEHKTEFIEEELIKEKSKTIWQRIFRK